MFTAAELRQQIRHAVDPNGDQLPLLDTLSETDKDAWVQMLGAGAAAQWDELRSLQQSYQGLLASMQDALEVLVPRGWAPFQMDSDATVEAIRLVRAGDPAAADQMLAGQWEHEGAWRTKRICDRVRTMGAGARQHDLEFLFQHRARLLLKAKDHHEAGRYEASIPIVHAQMEGIVMDVAAGKKVFYQRNLQGRPRQPLAVDHRRSMSTCAADHLRRERGRHPSGRLSLPPRCRSRTRTGL